MIFLIILKSFPRNRIKKIINPKLMIKVILADAVGKVKKVEKFELE